MHMFSFQTKTSGHAWSVWVCILLAIAAFFWVVGPLALNPQNVAWLDGGFDPAQHYLGWVFFRNSAWSFPLGLNPAFGMDISSSIVYSDSIPLLAFLFKPFAAFLPETFQYFGLWLLLCFILQSYFAWRLIALLQMPGIATIGAVILLLFSPPMFWRIGMHAALVAHWLILAALYLNFRTSRTHHAIYWAFLISSSALIHFYLLSMVLGLWIASLLDSVRMAKSGVNLFLNASPASQSSNAGMRLGLGKTVIELVFTLGALLLVMWGAGYFVVSGSDTATQSFGISRMNLLAPFDPQYWSYGLPNLPDAQGAISDVDMTARTYENFMYWGAGILLLILASIGLAVRTRLAHKQEGKIHHLLGHDSNRATNFDPEIAVNLSWRRHGALYLVLIGFTLFALSNDLALGVWSWSFPLPEPIYQIASMYRASSRFFWPAWYAIAFFLIAYVSRTLASTGLTILLMLCAIVQIVDTEAGWKSIRALTMKPVSLEFATELRDPFWQAAGSHYHQLVRIPVDSNWVKVLPPHWSTFANYAASHQIETNSVYLARQSAKKLEDSNAQLKSMLKAGQWGQRTLYIVGREEVITILAHSNPEHDLLAMINGHIVFAPGWFTCDTCPPITEAQHITLGMVQTQLDQLMGFDVLGNGKFFLQGPHWAYPESWGVWALGQRAELTLPLPKPVDSKVARSKPRAPSQLILEMRALVNPSSPSQHIGIGVNGQAPLVFTLKQDDYNRITIPLTPQVIKDGYVQLTFDLPTAKRPKDIGIGDDERLLSIGLMGARFN